MEVGSSTIIPSVRASKVIAKERGTYWGENGICNAIGGTNSHNKKRWHQSISDGKEGNLSRLRCHHRRSLSLILSQRESIVGAPTIPAVPTPELEEEGSEFGDEATTLPSLRACRGRNRLRRRHWPELWRCQWSLSRLLGKRVATLRIYQVISSILVLFYAVYCRMLDVLWHCCPFTRCPMFVAILQKIDGILPPTTGIEASVIAPTAIQPSLI